MIVDRFSIQYFRFEQEDWDVENVWCEKKEESAWNGKCQRFFVVLVTLAFFVFKSLVFDVNDKKRNPILELDQRKRKPKQCIRIKTKEQVERFMM